MINEKIQKFDRDHIWHPYTSMNNPFPVYNVVSAKGIHLFLNDGKELIDGMSSWWSAIHGYNHPVLNQALETQIKKMSHIMFGGLTHQPAAELASRLVELTPESLETVFFSRALLLGATMLISKTSAVLSDVQSGLRLQFHGHLVCNLKYS